MLGLALLELAPLLAGMDVADHAARLRIRCDLLEPPARDRAHAVGGDPDLDPGHARCPGPQRLHAPQERGNVRVAKAPLTRRRRQIRAVRPAAAVVGGRQEHDRQPGLDRGLGDRERHRVGLGVRGAVRLVVDVMKLAHDAVARAAHLRIGLERDLAHRGRVERLGQAEHLGPPRPEVVLISAARTLGTPPERPLERVRVGVRHGRDRRPGTRIAEFRRGAHERSSSARSTTRAPIAASSSDTDSSGEWLIPVGLRTSSIAAGTRSASTPASWPAKHTSSGAT